MLSGVALGVALALNGAALAAEAVAEARSTQHQVMAFDIPAQPLDRAALAFAEQAGVQVFFDSARLQGFASTALSGRYPLDEALRRLLGSAPVDYRFDGLRQVTLTRRALRDEQTLQLQSTTVQGRQLSQRQETYLQPRSVAVIDRQQIDRTPPHHAADLLEQSAGVYTAVSQQDPGLSVNIRGLQDYGRVNMNIDGMRQNYQQSGHQQRNGSMYVDPELLSGVVISKGASAGLRYDRYRLQGETGMTIRRFTPPATFTQEALTFDVDREEGRFSPTFGLAIKPGLDWLQVFASYGKGWRPPAVTETLIYGRPHGGGGEWMYPNPYLKPERSSAWEVGFNVFRQGLLQANDSLGIKVAYFDTRVDDFTYMAINRQVPGFGTGPTLGTVAHVNDLTSTRFRGVEYQANYDNGRFYADLTYTHMIGKNEYCSKNAWLGGAERFGFIPGVGVGSIPDDYANSLVSCGGLMGSSEYMPMDRGSLVLGTRWLDRRLDVGTRIRYSEGYTESYTERNLEAIYPADWASYVVYDFFAGYQATPQTRLSLSLENAFDRAYLVPLGDVYAFTLSRGRTLTGSVEYQF